MPAAIDRGDPEGIGEAVEAEGPGQADDMAAIDDAPAEAPPLLGVLVEINSETDFVARNELFQAFVRAVAALAIAGNSDVEALKQMPYPGTGRTVDEELTELMGRIGENLVLRRVARLAVEKGHVASYVHNSLAPGLGKIGVLVALESEASGEAIETLGRQLAMHVAAANPQYLETAAVPGSALDRERAVLREQAHGTGKTEAIIERMVEGRLRKFYEEVVLLDQIFVVDGESRVSKVVEAAAKTAGKPIRVAGFVRFALGEGVERPPSDFAAEVGAQLKS